VHLTSNGHVGNVLNEIMAEGFDFDDFLSFALLDRKITCTCKLEKWVSLNWTIKLLTFMD
jgi:hypothetical protein